jgi:hypothetical protein
VRQPQRPQRWKRNQSIRAWPSLHHNQKQCTCRPNELAHTHIRFRHKQHLQVHCISMRYILYLRYGTNIPTSSLNGLWTSQGKFTTRDWAANVTISESCMLYAYPSRPQVFRTVSVRKL